MNERQTIGWLRSVPTTNSALCSVTDHFPQDREAKLRQQITALESKVTRLQTELEQAKTAPSTHLTASALSAYQQSLKPPSRKAPYTNGGSHGRPDSRASTAAYGEREASVASYKRSSSRLTAHSSSAGSATPPPSQQPSVWDSMHAPSSKPSVSVVGSGRYPAMTPATPKARRYGAGSGNGGGNPGGPGGYYRGSMPSPTPSTVSLAPTQGEDGWWQ